MQIALFKKISLQLSAVVIVVISSFSSCTTSRSWIKADLLLDVSGEKTHEILASCSPDDYFALDKALFIKKGGLKDSSDSFHTVDDSYGVIEQRYCGTGFKEQPPLLEGAIQNIYLSDTRIQGLKDVTVKIESAPFIGPNCILITGTPIRFSAK